VSKHCAASQHHIRFSGLNHFRGGGNGQSAGGACRGHRHARAEQAEIIGDEINDRNAFVKPGGARTHSACFDQGRKKLFAIERAADGTAHDDTGAFSVIFQVDAGRGYRLASGQPSEPVAARTAHGSAERTEIALNFSGQDLAITGRLKEA